LRAVAIPLDWASAGYRENPHNLDNLRDYVQDARSTCEEILDYIAQLQEAYLNTGETARAYIEAPADNALWFDCQAKGNPNGIIRTYDIGRVFLHRGEPYLGATITAHPAVIRNLKAIYSERLFVQSVNWNP
jgi:hypothetical protein